MPSHLLVLFTLLVAAVAAGDHKLRGISEEAVSWGQQGLVVDPSAEGNFALSGGWEVSISGARGVQVMSGNGGVVWASVDGETAFLAVGTGRNLQEPISDDGGFTLEEIIMPGTRTNLQTIEASAVNVVDSTTTTLVLTGMLSRSSLLSSEELPYTFTFTSSSSSSKLAFAAHVEDQDESGSNSKNRLFLTYASAPDQGVFGFGTQYSVWNMKGRRVPILVTEQGVGRGLEPLTTILNTAQGGAGGYWHTTYAPIPAYVTTSNTSLFLDNSEFSAFDLAANDDRIDLEVWSLDVSGSILWAPSPLSLVTAVTTITGRMGPLPSWVQQGAIVGMEGGTKTVLNITSTLIDADVPVAGLWLQDWTGESVSWGNTRLWWNWEADDGVGGQYEGWADMIKGLRASHGIRTLSYINPYFVDVSSKDEYKRNYFQEGIDNSYFVMQADGSAYLLKCGSFTFGTIDLTNPEARTWMKQMITDNMIAPADGGAVSGWMNDFGEYLPLDAVLFSGEDAAAYHNRFPQEWGRLISEVLAENGVSDEVVPFSRSGWVESPSVVPIFWMGDQLTSWDDKDGIKTALIGMLTGGLTGRTLAHSDIGGYTMIDVGPDGLPWNYLRSKELLWRWIEMSAFSDCIFRTHPGLILEGSPQVYTDADTLAHFATFTRIHTALFDYRQSLIKEASNLGWPVVRSMWLHFPTDSEVLAGDGLVQQFLLGADLLVAPVLDSGASSVRVYLPCINGGTQPSSWTQLWTNETFGGCEWVEVDAPLGHGPAVFFPTGNPRGRAVQASVLAAL